MNHPGILNVFEMFQMPEKIALIMEFVEGGDLYQLIKVKKRMNEKEAAILIYKMIEALNALHKAGFVHRDLKLENIMLANKTHDDYQLKLVDFGFAEQINEKELKSKAGTPGYIAPEVFKG